MLSARHPSSLGTALVFISENGKGACLPPPPTPDTTPWSRIDRHLTALMLGPFSDGKGWVGAQGWRKRGGGSYVTKSGVCQWLWDGHKRMLWD